MNIVVFFGSDLEHYSPQTLHELHQQGSDFLALDYLAAEKLHQEAIPFQQVEDLIGVEENLNSHRWTQSILSRWFENGRRALTYNDICFPEFDSTCWRYVWKEIYIGFCLGKYFQSNPQINVYSIVNKEPTPGLFYYKSDVVKQIIAQAIPNRFRSLGETGQRRGVFNVPLFKFDLSNTRKYKYLLIINQGETKRFHSFILDFKSRYPDEFAVVYLQPNPKLCLENTDKFGVPFIGPTKTSEFEFKNEIDSISMKMNSTLDGVINSEILNQFDLNKIRYQFEYYFMYRWPRLVCASNSWKSLIRAVDPFVVFASNLQDSESQIPVEIAKQLGVTTFALPHGGARSVATPKPTPAHFQLFSSQIQYLRLSSLSNLEKENLQGCKGLVPDNVFEMQSNPMSFDHKLKILILTNNVGIQDNVACLHSRKSQFEAYQLFDKLGKKYHTKVQFLLKTHPMYFDIPSLNMGIEESCLEVIPANSDLYTVLESVDFVLGLNYDGSALCHVLKRKKPMIHYWNDPFILNHLDTHESSDTLFDELDIIQTANELEIQLQELMNNENKKTQLEETSIGFYDKFLSDTNYPDIHRIMENKLDEIIKNKMNFMRSSIV